MRKFLAVSGIFGLLLAAPSAYALHDSSHYALDGEAGYVMPGNASMRAVKLISDSDPGYGLVDFGVESSLIFADLANLSTDYMFETDDSCAGGAPRFQINVMTESGEKNIFAYIGPPPNYTNCPAEVWLNSGNVLLLTLDTSQLPGGTFYDPYATALVKYGSLTVTGIQLVADAGWAFADGEQAVTVDNTLINSTLFDYEPSAAEAKELCKNGGWQTMGDHHGEAFKNQGQCVSHHAKMMHE